MERSFRLLHGQPRQPFEWIYFPLLSGRIVLSNKKWNFRKYSVFFLKQFPKKKKLFGGPCISAVKNYIVILAKGLYWPIRYVCPVTYFRSFDYFCTNSLDFCELLYFSCQFRSYIFRNIANTIGINSAMNSGISIAVSALHTCTEWTNLNKFNFNKLLTLLKNPLSLTYLPFP